MDKILVEILKEAKGGNALKVLRAEFGFDYNKPIKAVRFKGEFTASSLKRDCGIDVQKMTVAVLFQTGCRFEIAEYSEGSVTLHSYCSPFRSVPTKKQFNEYRKDGFWLVYVVAQNLEYTLPRLTSWNRYLSNMDLNERFIPCGSFYKVERLESARSSNDHFSFRTDDLDKSGYPVSMKRDYLKGELACLIREKKAKAYKNMPNTQDMIAKARKAIDDKKNELVKSFASATSCNSVSEVAYSISKLSNCMQEIEQITRRDNEKRFDSPAEFNNSIKGIYDKLKSI